MSDELEKKLRDMLNDLAKKNMDIMLRESVIRDAKRMFNVDLEEHGGSVDRNTFETECKETLEKLKFMEDNPDILKGPPKKK
jgi:hypothetical protein